MDRTKTFSSAAAAVAVSLAMVTSTSALGACKTTLRGELVQAPVPGRAFPKKFLFFDLAEMTPASATGSEQRFQSFVVPNTSTTLPIPFALDIDSPKDCPSELELRISSEDTDQPTFFRFASYAPPLRGQKMIRLDKFESIPVWGPHF
ncbi:hypothetical protein [Bradyrhizobium sp. 170]|uniref:hypothetical protein n=1 Tax=Bradyrhizobium sp. 170 TaxID=2782641 RepID=UPI001FFEDA53|nr:hypothetical protein [Bradyrhizobium sp. 170]UPK00616.1 hypothetical protein IVB05_23010 [Bradyrhizobium sp. 170]